MIIFFPDNKNTKTDVNHAHQLMNYPYLWLKTAQIYKQVENRQALFPKLH